MLRGSAFAAFVGQGLREDLDLCITLALGLALGVGPDLEVQMAFRYRLAKIGQKLLLEEHSECLGQLLQQDLLFLDGIAFLRG